MFIFGVTVVLYFNDSITVTIIAKERDPENLRLKEAYYIRKLRPEINNREERSELTELLF